MLGKEFADRAAKEATLKPNSDISLVLVHDTKQWLIRCLLQKWQSAWGIVPCKLHVFIFVTVIWHFNFFFYESLLHYVNVVTLSWQWNMFLLPVRILMSAMRDPFLDSRWKKFLVAMLIFSLVSLWKKFLVTVDILFHLSLFLHSSIFIATFKFLIIFILVSPQPFVFISIWPLYSLFHFIYVFMGSILESPSLFWWLYCVLFHYV